MISKFNKKPLTAQNGWCRLIWHRSIRQWAALFLVLSGMAWTHHAWAQGRIEAADGVIVNLADKTIMKKVIVVQAKMARIGPVLRVQISLSNPGRSPVDIQYRPQWFDASGFEIPTNERWEPARIDGMTSNNIDVLGTDRAAKSVVINVKKR